MIEKIFLTKKTKSASASSFSELHVIGKEKIYSPTKLLEYLKCFLLFDVIKKTELSNPTVLSNECNVAKNAIFSGNLIQQQ
jgi:hypothetical protein